MGRRRGFSGPKGSLPELSAYMGKGLVNRDFNGLRDLLLKLNAYIGKDLMG